MMKNWQPIKLEEISGDTKAVYETLNKGSDLACVLIGTSYLSELLATTLKVGFIKSNVTKKLLDPQRGAIGSFATRADLAYCLGLIDISDYQDLIKVAEIRNTFAHQHLALDFNDSSTQEKCDELQSWRNILNEEKEEVLNKHIPESDKLSMKARNQFKLSVVLLGMYIHTIAQSQDLHKKNTKRTNNTE